MHSNGALCHHQQSRTNRKSRRYISVRETSGGFKGVFDERGKLLWTFSDTIYQEKESQAQNMLDMELKERIILNSRKMEGRASTVRYQHG